MVGQQLTFRSCMYGVQCLIGLPSSTFIERLTNVDLVDERSLWRAVSDKKVRGSFIASSPVIKTRWL